MKRIKQAAYEMRKYYVATIYQMGSITKTYMELLYFNTKNLPIPFLK